MPFRVITNLRYPIYIVCHLHLKALIRHGSWAGWAGNRPMATHPMGYGQVAGVY